MVGQMRFLVPTRDLLFQFVVGFTLIPSTGEVREGQTKKLYMGRLLSEFPVCFIVSNTIIGLSTEKQ